MNKISTLPKKENEELLEEPSYAAWLYALLLIILFFISWFSFTKFVKWLSSHEIVPQRIIAVTLKLPFTIKAREPQIIEKRIALEYPEEIDTPLEKYICDKFGPMDCKTALAVSLAENDTRQRDRIHINDNNTIDVGIFMINSVHFTKESCELYRITDPIQNVDCAFSIWQEQGWQPWVAFWNGAYLAKLK